MKHYEDSAIISHNKDQDESLSVVVERIKLRLKSDVGNLQAEIDELYGLVDQLTKFEFGRFLLRNQGGWNGDWTYRAITRPESDEPYSSPIEEFMFLKAPAMLATRERYGIFKKVLQRSLKDGIVMASIPCGVMADLLTLDYSGVNGVSLVGIDLDELSLKLAQQMANNRGRTNMVQFLQADAWYLNKSECYDVLTSNGLNIYVSDDEQVVALYRSFYEALKPSGMLLTSFLTPPPSSSAKCEWDLNVINMDDLDLQKKILLDILQSTWACFRSEQLTREQLLHAGFKSVEYVWGSLRMFPTVIAYK